MAEATSGLLEGQVALVTGCVRRIGRETTLTLAREGAAIVVHAQHSRYEAEALAKEIEDIGGEALIHLADVTDETAVQGLVDAIIERFGRIDILVNNAAIRKQTPFLDISLDEWHQILAIILDGAFLCTRACVPHMIKTGGGVIINMGGISPHVGSLERLHVAAGKAGMGGMTRSLAMELAEHNITVNMLAPGSIGGQRSATSPQSAPKIGGNKIPLGREGTFENVANMVHALCIPAGRYITGQTIHINGGKYLAS